jgi:hypothetical protein
VRRKLLFIAALSVLAMPAAATAGTTASKISAGASERCAALQAQLGATSFGQAFTSFGGCVSRVVPLELQNTSAATAACRAERLDAGFAAAHHGRSFGRVYGRKGLAACVALKAAAASTAERTGAPSPSRTCTALQGSLGANDFAKSYGSFATCLGWVAQNAINAQIAATSTCRVLSADFGVCVVMHTVLPVGQGAGAEPAQPTPPTLGCNGPGIAGIPHRQMCPVAEPY